jgi:uncharacterized protein
VAGMMPIRPFSHQDPAWNVYITSDDIEATCNAVSAAGGLIRTGPLGIATHGSMVVAEDPAGAVVRFWQAGNHRGAELVAEPGAMVWHELITPDPRASDAFYQAVFPYEVKQLPQAAGADHVKYMLGGRPAAGRLQPAADWPDRDQAGWLTYFQVAGVDATIQRIRELGGTRLYGPKDIRYGPFAVCRDPFGASFSILVPEAPQSLCRARGVATAAPPWAPTRGCPRPGPACGSADDRSADQQTNTPTPRRPAVGSGVPGPRAAARNGNQWSPPAPPHGRPGSRRPARGHPQPSIRSPVSGLNTCSSPLRMASCTVSPMRGGVRPSTRATNCSRLSPISHVP